MKIKVLYFAHVKDITKKNEEYIDTDLKNLSDLKKMIFNKYPEMEHQNNLLIAVNNEYMKDCKLNNDDTVAFFPPVSGG